MMTSRASILMVLVAGALGGCVSDAHGGDPEPDSDSDSDLSAAPAPDPATRRRPRPRPDPGPGNACTPIGGPSTVGATLDGIDYEVTGGPTGAGDGTSLHMAQDGSVTLHTRERGAEQGWLDGLTLYGLFRKATSAQLPTLCAIYSCDGCGNDYIHNLSVRLNDVPYTVRVSFRSLPPAPLAALIDAVQNITTRPPQ